MGKSISQDHQYSHALPQVQKPGIIKWKHMKETVKKLAPTSKNTTSTNESSIVTLDLNIID